MSRLIAVGWRLSRIWTFFLTIFFFSFSLSFVFNRLASNFAVFSATSFSISFSDFLTYLISDFGLLLFSSLSFLSPADSDLISEFVTVFSSDSITFLGSSILLLSFCSSVVASSFLSSLSFAIVLFIKFLRLAKGLSFGFDASVAILISSPFIRYL